MLNVTASLSSSKRIVFREHLQRRVRTQTRDTPCRARAHAHTCRVGLQHTAGAAVALRSSVCTAGWYPVLRQEVLAVTLARGVEEGRARG